MQSRLTAVKLVFVAFAVVAGGTEPSDLLTAWWLLFLATGWLPWSVMHFMLPGPEVWAVVHLAEAVGAGFAILVATALAERLDAAREPREQPDVAAPLEAARG